MTICGWCHGTGVNYGKACICKAPARRYFPKKVTKRIDDTIAPAHRHDFRFLDRAGHKEWFMCDCGKTKTIYVD
jgi:hypothetical protein